MIQMILRKQDKVGLKAYYNDRNVAEDEIYASPLNIYLEKLEKHNKEIKTMQTGK